MSLGTGLGIEGENKGLLVECFSSATNMAADALGIKQAPAQDQSIDVAADGDTKTIDGITYIQKGDKWYFPGVLEQGGSTGTGNHVVYGPGQSPKWK